MGYDPFVIEIRETREFSQWLGKLKDTTARARILARIQRLACGLAGDAKPVGHGVSEMRIHAGPGYRVYFCQRGQSLIVLLAGGDKAPRNATSRLRNDWRVDWSKLLDQNNDQDKKDPHPPLRRSTLSAIGR